MFNLILLLINYLIILIFKITIKSRRKINMATIKIQIHKNIH